MLKAASLFLGVAVAFACRAQVPPSPAEAAAYGGLLAAAARGDAAGIRTLIAQGANPGDRDAYGRTPLHVAAYGAHLGHAAVVRRLIAAGAPLDHVNNLGWTALIEVGASVNLADRDGLTPLTLARRQGHWAMTRLLERAGAR